MTSQEQLIEAFGELGEAAGIYKGPNIRVVNDRFAEFLERSKEEFVNLPITEIIHNDSIEMIQDYRRRRTHEDHGVPTTYTAYFKTPKTPMIELKLFVLRLKHGEGEVLVLLRKK